MASGVSYTPAPYEQAYYDGLFQAADVNRRGVLGGAEAVGFFTRSKLPQDVLKNIWTLADQNPTNSSLDKRKFATAVRLIQLTQNGQKAQGANLDGPPGVTLRPAFFEGVSGVSLQPPQAPQQQQAPQQMQQQQPPPQQMQQPPLSPNRLQQQQMRAPPTPPRPLMQPQPSAMSMALTPQDPYSLPPQEQARYEGLFPQYDKGDGYVYGQEAVGLFSKSGLPQPVLRDIWNMVDSPVDNRLDKLEFAMAMHLIVCVSKKNLPVPPYLPPSLKALKSQQPGAPAGGVPSPPMRSASPAMSAPPGGMQSMPQMGGSTVSLSGSAPGGFAPPPLQQQQPMGSSMSASGMSVGEPPQIHNTPPTEIHAAPPIQPAGGMNISDAFEGLDGPGMGQSSFQMNSGPPPITGGSMASAPSYEHPPVPAAVEIPEPEVSSPEPAPAPAPVMQAPPKSTKELASSYDMGDDVTELGKLKNQLQKLQAENISLKASLGSMTEEEREIQKEISATVAEIGKLSNSLTTLRGQVLAAKSALLEATAELKMHKEKKAMIADLIDDAHATKDAINSALDSVHEVEKVGAQQQTATMAAAPVMEADLFSFDSPAKAAPTQPENGQGHPPITTVSTTEDEDDEPVENNHDAYHANNVTEMSFGAPAAAQEMSFGAPPAPAQGYGQGLKVASSYEEDGVMGGPASLSPTPFSGESPAVPHKTFGNDMAPSSPTIADVESLKERARQAEQTATEAEETRRALAQQADDLRKIADQVEQESREKESHAQKKKRGFGGGKRKEMREAEKAKQDAAEKQRQFMDVQNQAANAQVLALETRREADRLRQQAEQAEIEAAQAASMHDAHPTDFSQMAASAPAPAPITNGDGYGGAHHEKQPSYGGFGGGFGIMGGAAPTNNGGGFGIPSPPGSDGGFGY